MQYILVSFPASFPLQATFKPAQINSYMLVGSKVMVSVLHMYIYSVHVHMYMYVCVNVYKCREESLRRWLANIREALLCLFECGYG